MHWFVQALRGNPELGLLLSIAFGFALGRVRFGSFQLGPMLGTLIAGLVIGQLGIEAPRAMQSEFFLMFLFALGFRTGPEFFQGLRANAVPQIGLSALFVATSLGLAWMLSGALRFDGGTAAGLLAGSSTSSTALGAATQAALNLGLDPRREAVLARHVANAYTLTYLLGTVLVIWLLPRVGPWLMRVNLRDACRELELSMGLPPGSNGTTSAYQDIVAEAYRIPDALRGKTVADLEALWPSDARVVVERVRRTEALIDATPETVLHTGDIVAVAGRFRALFHDSRPVLEPVDDRALLNVPIVSADIVITRANLAGRELGDLSRKVGVRGIFALKLRRGGRELPFARHTTIERGDVLTVTGREAEIARVAAQAGYAEYPTSATDLMLVTGAMVIGGLIGLMAIPLGAIQIGLSAPVGVLLAGLILGHLRLMFPRLGRVPDASIYLFESLGLASFLALVGLSAGPGLVDAFKQSGVQLLAAGAVLSVVPLVVTILIGRYVAGMHPGILLGICAGAGTSAPALAEIEKSAQSRIPTLGYGLACAVGNVLLALSGTLLVMLGSH